MFKLSSVNQEIIKNVNKKKILNLLSKKRELTKQDISKQTGISIPTVTKNINELINAKIVMEAGVAKSTGGRKPVIIRFLPNSRYSFGVDFDVDNIRIILTNLDSEIIYDKKYNIGEFDNIKDDLCHIIEEIMDSNNISNDEILGIGVSLPGIVNEESKILKLAPNMGIKNLDFNELEKVINIPFYVENEANAAALAELSLGIAKQMRNLVYLSITQGIGAGVVIKGSLYKGKNKKAGELGHMTIVDGGKKCKCGKRGCWELYASERALLESYNSFACDKISSLKEFLALIKQKDAMAKSVWNNYLNYLSTGIQNIILIMDPDYIILGGKISYFEDVLLNSLKKKVFIENSFFDSGQTKILTSKLKNNSSILGASLLPLHKLFYVDEKII